MVGSLVRATVLSVITMFMLAAYSGEARCTPEPVTTVRGMVTLDSYDKPESVAGVTVSLQGDYMIVSAVTDREGKFHFVNLEPGTYLVEATYLGLYAEQKITVKDGSEVQVNLQLKQRTAGNSAER